MRTGVFREAGETAWYLSRDWAQALSFTAAPPRASGKSRVPGHSSPCHYWASFLSHPEAKAVMSILPSMSALTLRQPRTHEFSLPLPALVWGHLAFPATSEGSRL